MTVYDLRIMSNKVLLLSLLVTLAGCGGGSSEVNTVSDQMSPDAPIANLPSTNTSIVNPSLPDGEIFIGGAVDGPRILNLRTGRYRQLDGFNWEEREDDNFLAYFAAFFSVDRQEILESFISCELKPEVLAGWDDCIVFRDLNGRETGRFVIPVGGTLGLGLFEPAKLSPDRQFVAAVVDIDGGSLGRLMIFNRSGEVISESDERWMTDGGYFTWLPDNSIIYASQRSLYSTSPNSAKGTLIARFGEDAGEPEQLAISPDGNKLAFALVTALRPYRGTV